MLAAEKLQAALKERGIGLAAVTPEEAYASERTAAFARAVGNHARTLGEGEIIAVDGRGNAWRLDERVTRQPRDVIEERLAGIDRDQLPGLDAAKEATREASKAAWRAQRDEERAQARINEPVTGAVADIRMAFALAPDGPAAAPLQEALAARSMTHGHVKPLSAATWLSLDRVEQIRRRNTTTLFAGNAAVKLPSADSMVPALVNPLPP